MTLDWQLDKHKDWIASTHYFECLVYTLDGKYFYRILFMDYRNNNETIITGQAFDAEDGKCNVERHLRQIKIDLEETFNTREEQ